MTSFSRLTSFPPGFSTANAISTINLFESEADLAVSNSSENMAEVEYYAHVAVMPVVLAIGMANQCLNVATLWQLQSGCFLYLKASAIADILSIISFIPFILRHAGLSNERSLFIMSYHAYFELPIINGLICASAFCIVAMTVDRYLSVCHPIHFYNSLDSAKRAPKVIIILFLTAFMVYTPSIWQKELVKREDEDFYQVVRREENLPLKIYLGFRELVSRWGPMLILVVLNSAMMRSLYRLERKPTRRSIKYRKKENGRTDRTGSNDHGYQRISVLLLITSTTFVLCNLPASFLSLFVRHVSTDSLFWQAFKAIANLLQVTSYLYNFYLYALCSSEYRAALKRLLQGERRNSSLSTDDSPTFRDETAPLRSTLPDLF